MSNRGSWGLLQVDVVPDAAEIYMSLALDPTLDKAKRFQALMQYAKTQPGLSPEDRTLSNRVMGCTAQVMGATQCDCKCWGPVPYTV